MISYPIGNWEFFSLSGPFVITQKSRIPDWVHFSFWGFDMANWGFMVHQILLVFHRKLSALVGHRLLIGGQNNNWSLILPPKFIWITQCICAPFTSVCREAASKWAPFMMLAPRRSVTNNASLSRFWQHWLPVTDILLEKDFFAERKIQKKILHKNVQKYKKKYVKKLYKTKSKA